MALTQAILKLAIVEDRDANVPAYTFTDTTDYTDNGVTFANVKAAIKIEIGYTTIYDNLANISTTPDLDGSSAGQTNGDLVRSRTKTAPIQLPTNTDGSFKEGLIKITYRVTDGSTTVTNLVTLDNTFTTPTGNLDYTVVLDPTQPSITVDDETNYVVNSITPTKTRTLSLFYPSSTGESASTTSAEQLRTERFYTGQQEAKLSTVCSWVYTTRVDASETNDWVSGNFSYTINDTVTDTEYINVESDTSVCDIFCCISEFSDRVQTAKTSNPTEYNRLLQIQGQVAFYLNAISNAFACSTTGKVNTWVDIIKDLVNCKGDCSCSDDTPTLIVPVTGSSVTLGNVKRFTTTTAQSTVQYNDLINKVYNTTQQDFMVFLDGIEDTGSFVSSSGTYTFANPQPAGVAGKVIILK